jgi:methylenetetrahydrofolate dehydrogenase (NADP+)/methenyltetrahydrofolate cyclohydrolase
VSADNYQLIDGKKISEIIIQEIAEETKLWIAKNHRAPHLAAILVGNDGASETYVASKIKMCEKVGFKSSLVRCTTTITEKQLLGKIEKLNNDDSVDGFIIQLPLPRHISELKVIEAIHPAKDIDGFHPSNIGRMALNLPSYLPATPFGICTLLERYGIETEGKNCVVIGRSHIVGAPMSMLLSRNSNPGNCTVTLCHSKTKNLKEVCKHADIIIAALGKPEFITADFISKGAVVIDVGIHRVEDKTNQKGYSIKGDVKFSEVAPLCSYITPVPGGVGPMTIVALLQNTLMAAKKEVY